MQLVEGNFFDNRYRLLRLLGTGGFSEVWLAEDSKVSNQMKALKVYAPGKGMDDDGLQAFSQEFGLVFNLNHSNLLCPSHFDVCQQMRLPYLVLPFCERGSASKLTGNITEEQAWQFLHDVASGLEYLHAQTPPIIHQDIKPDNVLINSTGEYKITDFGISARARSTLRKSMGNVQSAMTVAYSPPERFSEDPTPIMASDVWALGATMYELLEGDVPFIEMLGGLAQKNGAEIPAFDRQWTPELKNAVLRCLQLETWDRPMASQLVKWAQEKLQGKKPNVPPIPKSRPTARQDQKPKPKPDPVPKPDPTPKPPKKRSNKKFIWIALGVVALMVMLIFGLLRSKDGDAGRPAESSYREPATFLIVDPASLQFVAAGEAKTIDVQTDGSEPTATTTQSWISVSTSGNTVRVACQANTSTSARSGTITIRSDTRETTVSVRQLAAEPMVVAPTTATYLNASPTSLRFDAAGGTQTASVSTDGSTYRATTSQSWLTVTTSGNTVRVVCSANTSTSARSGRITITSDRREVTVDVTQAAAAPAAPRTATYISASPNQLSFAAAGETRQVTVSTDGSTFSARASDTNWMQVSISGNTVRITCRANTITSARSGTITITSDSRVATVSVTQAAAAPATATRLSVSPNQLSFVAAGGTQSTTVSTDGSTFRATTSQAWLTVTTSGNTVRVVCSANTSTSARSGTITITSDSRTATVSVTQAAGQDAAAARQARLDLYHPSGRELGTSFLVSQRKSDNKWGIIDRDGNVRIDFIYTQGSSRLRDGNYGLLRDGKWDVFGPTANRVATGVTDLGPYR